jgi:hypothetical protein
MPGLNCSAAHNILHCVSPSSITNHHRSFGANLREAVNLSLNATFLRCLLRVIADRKLSELFIFDVAICRG